MLLKGGDGGKQMCVPCLLGALLVLGIAIVGAWWVLHSANSSPQRNLPPKEELDAMVQYGQEELTKRMNAGEDLSSGPCLDNGVRFPGWVIDIVHSPREPVDDIPEHQCAAYRNGQAQHFIELNLDANIVRVGP